VSHQQNLWPRGMQLLRESCDVSVLSGIRVEDTILHSSLVYFRLTVTVTVIVVANGVLILLDVLFIIASSIFINSKVNSKEKTCSTATSLALTHSQEKFTTRHDLQI
jgi:hypothetical protein